MGEKVYNLISNTQSVILDLKPGNYGNEKSVLGLKLVRHTGIKKGDEFYVSARFSIHGVTGLKRVGFEPAPHFGTEQRYYGCWATKNDFDGIISKRWYAFDDFSDGMSIGQVGIYFQGNNLTIGEGGYVKVDHVMMNVGSEPAAWAPSAEEEISVGGVAR